ncbi:MAG: IS66-like element accessory protein TnpA [Janthinobacterium lividum]
MAPVTSTDPMRRGRFSTEFKAKLAALARNGDVSVARLARDYGLNANMLFRWRHEYRKGQLTAPVETDPLLMPVSLVEQAVAPIVEMPSAATRFGNIQPTKPLASTIEIRIADAVVHLQGENDVVRLRAVLSALRQ